MKNYQFPDRNRVWRFHAIHNSNEISVEICRRKTRADMSIAIHGPASGFVYEEIAFRWTKVVYSPEFPMSKLDHRFIRMLSPTSCFLGGLPVQIVRYLADRLIPELLWFWDELKGIGYSNEDDDLDSVTVSSARVMGRAN